MTANEAIKMLEIQKPAYGCKEYQKPLMYAYEMAIKALEKQIPKKPISYDDCEQFVIRCTCGKCTDTRFFHGYCTWCGQKLDWSDEE